MWINYFYYVIFNWRTSRALTEHNTMRLSGVWRAWEHIEENVMERRRMKKKKNQQITHILPIHLFWARAGCWHVYFRDGYIYLNTDDKRINDSIQSTLLFHLDQQMKLNKFICCCLHLSFVMTHVSYHLIITAFHNI